MSGEYKNCLPNNCESIKDKRNNSGNQTYNSNAAAKKALLNKNPDSAFEYFEKANNIAGCGYCELLKGNIREAKILLNLVRNSSSFVNWLLFLIDLTEEKYGKTTYFQVRNFYEQDLEMLIMYKRNNEAERIIQKCEYISGFNREVYKYCARVLLNNGYIKESEIMLRNSLEVCYNDPETHYMLGEVNIIKDNRQEAVYQFETSSKVNGGYYPAEQKIRQIMMK